MARKRSQSEIIQSLIEFWESLPEEILLVAEDMAAKTGISVPVVLARLTLARIISLSVQGELTGETPVLPELCMGAEGLVSNEVAMREVMQHGLAFFLSRPKVEASVPLPPSLADVMMGKPTEVVEKRLSADGVADPELRAIARRDIAKSEKMMRLDVIKITRRVQEDGSGAIEKYLTDEGLAGT